MFDIVNYIIVFFNYLYYFKSIFKKIDYKNIFKDVYIIISNLHLKMDLKQRKLNKSEWNSIEVSVSKQEIDILDMIIKGYYDPNIRVNNNIVYSFKYTFR